MNNYQLPNKNDIKTILDKYIAENESQGNFTFLRLITQIHTFHLNSALKSITLDMQLIF